MASKSWSNTMFARSNANAWRMYVHVNRGVSREAAANEGVGLRLYIHVYIYSEKVFFLFFVLVLNSARGRRPLMSSTIWRKVNKCNYWHKRKIEIKWLCNCRITYKNTFGRKWILANFRITMRKHKKLCCVIFNNSWD
jgi:hypothetical protein